MMDYDTWLEEPYQRVYAESDAFVEWCEANDRRPDDDGVWDAWVVALENAAEDAAEARAERE